MQVDVICKVIDNFGDAGFCLRLARALVDKGHRVRLYHDDDAVFAKLQPQLQKSLDLIDTREQVKPAANPPPDLIIEPFGTSSEQTSHRFDLRLKHAFPNIPWLLVDYLSAESWVEDFHLKQSKDPSTGHVSTYFYPGFTPETGGLIHCDVNAGHFIANQQKRSWSDRGLDIFVFAYNSAPLTLLFDACATHDKIVIAPSSGFTHRNDHRISVSPFVSQEDFDALLVKHDAVFVRGEDSFVRAQLLGLPFVWQIYPTTDGQHLHKLHHFLRLYLQGCKSDLASAVCDVFLCWNEPSRQSDLAAAWKTLQAQGDAWVEHSRLWQKRLLDGPELVGKILTWHFDRPPTLPK